MSLERMLDLAKSLLAVEDSKLEFRANALQYLVGHDRLADGAEAFACLIDVNETSGGALYSSASLRHPPTQGFG